MRLLRDPSSPAVSVPPLLDEPSLFYDPPYASAMHDTFAWHLVKYLQPGSGLRYQVEGPTVDGLDLAIDFVVEQPQRCVGFMCGPSPQGAVHDRRADALRIGKAMVDVLYRLPAEAVERHLHDVLLLVARWDADLFSKRGQINLQALATPGARAVRPRPTDAVLTLRYDETAPQNSPQNPASAVRIQRLSRAHPEAWEPAFEQACPRHRRAASTPLWARSA